MGLIQQEEARHRKLKELRAPVSTKEFRSQIGRLGTMMMTVLEQTNAGRNALAVLEQKHGPVPYHRADETLSSTMAVDLQYLACLNIRKYDGFCIKESTEGPIPFSISNVQMG